MEAADPVPRSRSVGVRAPPERRDPRDVRERLRRVGVVMRGELGRAGGSFDPKTLLALGLLGLLMMGVTAVVQDRGFDFDHGIYRVVADEGSPVYPAVTAAPVFQVVSTAPGDAPEAWLLADDADIVIDGLTVMAADTDKGNAALGALTQAVKDHTYRLMSIEPDQAAAFPLLVELVYVQQDAQGPPRFGIADDGSRPGGSDGGGGEAGVEGNGDGGHGGDGAQGGEGESGGSGDGSDGSSGGSAPAPPSTGEGTTKGFSFLPPERSVNTPESLAPPFPFRSLLLAYFFLLPMNFVVQVYAGSIIRERLGRTGEALLASPATAWEVIAGKTLPYLVLMLGISIGIALLIGAGWLTILAILPLILVFLALEFVAALFARSFRELTFLTVFASVLLTMYAFLPAAFTEVHPVALVSPIAVVVMDLRDTAITVPEFLYATLPLTLVALVLFILGKALYREEDLFHQKPVFSKMVDAVSRQVHGIASGLRLSVLFIPFVFVTELMLVAFLFAWPMDTGVVGVLLVVALVEETFKGVPSYAAASRGLVGRSRLLGFGALVGVGFFLAEKGFLMASAVGLYDIDAGEAVFGSTGALIQESGVPWLVVIALLAAPLLLHVLTASITAIGARHGKQAFGLAFVLAVLLHLVYNLSALRIFGGGV